jgi:alanyl-tRNA synthetase
VAVGVTADLLGQRDAVELVKRAVAAVGGQGGGGRPDMAQGGGPDGTKAADALQAVRDGLALQPATA